jgi:hypothetical protein
MQSLFSTPALPPPEALQASALPEKKVIIPIMRMFLSITAVLVLFSSSAGAATIDPDFRFRTRETEHFHIHYHQGLEDTARRAAQLAERSHTLLTAALGWTPEGKTHMVLVDSSDLANGFATVLPYNLIYVYTVPPSPGTSIGQYEDWLGMVITHEYAHILTMDASRGYSWLFRTIFGKPVPGSDILSLLTFLFTVPPNVLLPDWWLEGISVWAETEFAGMGRGNGTYYEMYLRSAVAEDNLPSIDMINGDPPDWPAGNRPYIYGLALMRHISRHYDVDTLMDLNMGHAGRLPYMIGSPARKNTGLRYSALFREAMNELRVEQEEKIEAITKAGLTLPAVYPAIGESMTNPSPSPDESLVALRLSDPHRHDSIVILDNESDKVLHDIRVRPSGDRIAWGPQGEDIFFTEAELEGGYNLYMDLYSYDINKERKHRLTRGQRVKEPDVSKNKKVALIVIGPESQSLALLLNGPSGEERAVHVLKEFPGMRLSHPSWCPRERHIVFSARDAAGKSYIMAYNLKDGNLTTLLERTHDINYTTYTPDGNKVLYVSDETGIFNIYEFDILSRQSRRLSNLLGGAIGLELGAGGRRIYFSSYTSRGFRSAYIPYTGTSTKSVHAPSIQPSWPLGGFSNTATVFEENETPGQEIKPKEDRSYSALQSILPRFWLPSLWSDHKGGGPGIFTGGQDALSYHSFLFSGGIGGSGRGYYDLNYRYDRFYPSFYLRAGRLPVVYTEFFNSISSDYDTDLYDQEESVSASIELPLRRVEWHATLEAGYEYKRHSTLESLRPVFEGRRDSIFARLTHSSAAGYPYSISREEGRDISFTVRDYSRNRNSDIEARQYKARYEEFISLGGHRALYMLLGGGASKGDRIEQQAFRIGGTWMENLDYPLRGYPPGYRAGDYIAFSTIELRMPVLNIQKGPGTFPVFARQLHGALFAEAAAVWNDGESLNQEIADPSAGVELRVDLNLGYKIYVTPSIGYAHGFSKDSGEDIVYFVIHAAL